VAIVELSSNDIYRVPASEGRVLLHRIVEPTRVYVNWTCVIETVYCMVVAIPFLRCEGSREISQLDSFLIRAERDPVGVWSTIIKDMLEPQDVAAQIDRGLYARLAPTSLLTDRVPCLARWSEKIASRT
jgi:hypothetical protein